MEAEEITELFRRLESTANKCEGVECRSARELPTQLGHAKWERFCDVTDKAKEACLNAGENPEGHFPHAGKMAMLVLAPGERRQPQALPRAGAMKGQEVSPWFTPR